MPAFSGLLLTIIKHTAAISTAPCLSVTRNSLEPKQRSTVKIHVSAFSGLFRKSGLSKRHMAADMADCLFKVLAYACLRRHILTYSGPVARLFALVQSERQLLALAKASCREACSCRACQAGAARPRRGDASWTQRSGIRLSTFFGEVASELQKAFANAFDISDAELTVAARTFAAYSDESSTKVRSRAARQQASISTCPAPKK